LTAPILEGKADAVFGSRFAGTPRRVLFFWHSLANKILTLVSNMVNDLNLTVSGDALARLPKDIDRMAMAAVGLVGVTAFQGLNKLGALEGRRVLVTGAAGGVGSAAVSIARAEK